MNETVAIDDNCEPYVESYIVATASLQLASVIVTILYLTRMRFTLKSYSLELDSKAFTPSDFCVQGINMKFENYNPKAISQSIKKHFKLKYDLEVEYVNAAFDISDFFKLSERFHELLKLK